VRGGGAEQKNKKICILYVANDSHLRIIIFAGFLSDPLVPVLLLACRPQR